MFVESDATKEGTVDLGFERPVHGNSANHPVSLGPPAGRITNSDTALQF